LSENLWRYLYPVLEEKVVKMELNQIKDLMQRVKETSGRLLPERMM